jgi:glycosyltransferase involved in cell wall biosynthesis
MGDLAEALAGRGHGVTVITSAAGYGAAGGDRPPVPGGIRVLRAGPDQAHRHGLLSKLGDYALFFLRANRALAQLEMRPDVLVCLTTPPFCGLIGARLRRRCDVPYLLWCMDLYPEALAASGFPVRGNPIYALLRKLANAERRGAAAVVALGPDMTARLAASGTPRVHEIHVWSCLEAGPSEQAEARVLRRSRGWADDDVILLYSGNMGRAHRAAEFAGLAAHLRGRSPRCRFVFSGDGPSRAAWQRRWQEVFEFMPGVPEKSTTVHLLSADVHLVSQQPEWRGVVVPSKFQAACALGRPVVFAGPSDSAIGTWLAETDAGWVLPPGDSAAVVAAAGGMLAAPVRMRKGQGARELFGRHFTRSGNCAKLIQLIEQAAQNRP